MVINATFKIKHSKIERYARKRIKHESSMRKENSVPRDHCFASLGKASWCQTVTLGTEFSIRTSHPRKRLIKSTIQMVILNSLLLDWIWCGRRYIGPRQANLVLIAYASCEGSGEPAHPRSLARTFAARSYIQWIKRNLQTESQIPGPSEWLGIRSWNLSWRNARRHKFAWRGSYWC